MNILVTGGAGYIGSHTCIELLDAGYDVVVVDNLSNSKFESLKRVQEITGKRLAFQEYDLLEKTAIESIFHEHAIDAVIQQGQLERQGGVDAKVGIAKSVMANSGLMSSMSAIRS